VASFTQGFEENRANARILTREQIDSLKAISDEITLLGDVLVVEFAPKLLGVVKAIRWMGEQVSETITWMGGVLAEHEQVMKDAPKYGAVATYTGYAWWKETLGGKDRILNSAGKLLGDQAAEYDDRMKQEAERLRKLSEMRANRNLGGAGPIYDRDASAGGKTASAKAIAEARGGTPESDALVRVGNFLGTNMNAKLVTLAERQWETQKRMLAYFVLNNQVLKEISRAWDF